MNVFFFGKTILEWDDLGGKPTIFGITHIYVYVQIFMFSPKNKNQHQEAFSLFVEGEPWKILPLHLPSC